MTAPSAPAPASTSTEIRLSPLPRLWYAALALVILVAFALQFYLLLTGGADSNSGETGSSAPLGVRFVRLFSFFTIQSNVLVLITSLLLAIRGRLGGWLGRVISLDALLGITVTGLVFGLVLDASLQLRELANVTTTLFHYVSPTMLVLGWLLFGPRRQWSIRIALLAFVWPVLWLVGTFTVGAATGWYPYPFLDVNVVGLGAALLGAGLVVALALVLVTVALLVDRRAPALGVAKGRSETP